jgi:hypothetical protein
VSVLLSLSPAVPKEIMSSLRSLLKGLEYSTFFPTDILDIVSCQIFTNYKISQGAEIAQSV